MSKIRNWNFLGYTKGSFTRSDKDRKSDVAYRWVLRDKYDIHTRGDRGQEKFSFSRSLSVSVNSSLACFHTARTKWERSCLIFFMLNYQSSENDLKDNYSDIALTIDQREHSFNVWLQRANVKAKMGTLATRLKTKVFLYSLCVQNERTFIKTKDA